MKKLLLTTCMLAGLLIGISPTTFAQTQKTSNEELKVDSALFDFWVGKWNLTWDDGDGKMGKGTNHIHRTMGDFVIQENFKALEGNLKGYDGMSVSVFNRRTQTWQQTWVDNQGGYLEFVHDIDGQKRLFKREITTPTGQKIMQHMIFYNITEDSFDWDWETSRDEGKSWTFNWRIHYERAE